VSEFPLRARDPHPDSFDRDLPLQESKVDVVDCELDAQPVGDNVFEQQFGERGKRHTQREQQQ